MCNQNSCFGGSSCCWIIIAIILLFLFCGNGCGCGNDCGFNNMWACNIGCGFKTIYTMAPSSFGAYFFL